MESGALRAELQAAVAAVADRVTVLESIAGAGALSAAAAKTRATAAVAAPPATAERSQVERLAKENRALTARLEKLEGALKDSLTSVDDLVHRQVDEAEKRFRTLIASESGRQEQRLVKRMQELHVSVRSLDDSRARELVKSRMSAKESEIMVEQLVKESHERYEQKLRELGKVIDGLMTETTAKNAELVALVEKADRRSEEGIQTVWHQLNTGLEETAKQLHGLIKLESSDRLRVASVVSDLQSSLNSSTTAISSRVLTLERALRDQVAELQEAVRSSQSDEHVSLNGGTDVVEVLTDRVSRLESELLAQQRSVRALPDALDAATTSKVTRLQEQVLELKQSLLDVSENLFRVTQDSHLGTAEDVKNLREELAEAASDIASAKALQQTIARVEREVMALKVTVNNFEDKVASDVEVQRSQLAEVSQSISADVKVVRDLRPYVDRKCAALQEQTAAALEKLRGNLLETMQALNSNCVVTVNQHDAHLRALRERLEPLSDEVDGLRQQVQQSLRAARTEVEKRQEEAVMARSLMESAQAKASVEMKQRQDVEAQLKESMEKVREFEASMQRFSRKETTLRDELTKMKSNVDEMEFENIELRNKEWYRCRHPEDPVDVAVSKTLQATRFPIRVDFRRLSPGVYMGDRRVNVSLVNSVVLVRRGGGYQPLTKYLEEFMYPILVAKFGAERASAYVSSVPDAHDGDVPSVSLEL